MSIHINDQELSALRGLPYLQRLIYLMSIRPYVDYKTGIAGLKRGISYQSITEDLYIEPHPGINSSPAGKQQIRRAIKGLERVGLLTIQSFDWKLIFHCPLVTSDYCVQNKADTNPTQQADTNPTQKHPIKSRIVELENKKQDTSQTTKADTPLNNSYLYFLFEKFWESYPQKKSKQKAQAVFEQLNPDEHCFVAIMQGLDAQKHHRALTQARGQWVPAWKYPENWLANRCWEDVIATDLLEEPIHAQHTTQSKKQSRRDPFCPPIESDDQEADTGNVIQFQQYRESR